MFTDEEIEKFEFVPLTSRILLSLTDQHNRYNADISMNAIWGSRLPNNGGAVMGSIYINTLIDR